MHHAKHGLFGFWKIQKLSNKQKWTNKEYQVQKTEYFELQNVKTYCTTKQFPKLTFCGSHNKPHGVHEFSKNYHMRFDPKLGHGTCAICCIPYTCNQFKYTLGKPLTPGVLTHLQPRYQPLKDCKY